MDKFITLDFCKKHQKFPTKTDFMTFVNSESEIVKFMKGKSMEIQEFKETILENFDEFLEEPQIVKRKTMFLASVKERQKERVDQKKKVEKEILKDTLREEIIREMEDEKMEELSDQIDREFKEYVPLNPDLKEKFRSWLLKDLTEDQFEDLKKLKEESDKLYKAQQKWLKKVELFESDL